MRRRRRSTIRASFNIRNRIDELRAEGVVVSMNQEWEILTALRGPDRDEDRLQHKLRFTMPIRQWYLGIGPAGALYVPFSVTSYTPRQLRRVIKQIARHPDDCSDHFISHAIDAAQTIVVLEGWRGKG